MTKKETVSVIGSDKDSNRNSDDASDDDSDSGIELTKTLKVTVIMTKTHV